MMSDVNRALLKDALKDEQKNNSKNQSDFQETVRLHVGRQKGWQLTARHDGAAAATSFCWKKARA